jgi:CRP/FNR family transcriptional regulator, anaerobic regulatory protein
MNSSAPQKINRPAPPASLCAVCGVKPLSMCAALEGTGQDELEALLVSVALAPGDVLFEEGLPARYSFNLTGGCLKLYKLLPDGRRLVTDFLYPGDFLGLADQLTYACTAEAVGPVSLCRFEREALEGLVQRQSCLERHLLERARAELADGREQLLLLGQKTARERVASFILAQSARARHRGLPASPIDTPMRRADIADHLGLTTETVSRTLTRLTQDGLIGVEAGRRILIRQADRLAEVAAGH